MSEQTEPSGSGGKTPMQADGSGSRKQHADGVSERPSGRKDPGESGGGAYPHPGGTSESSRDDFLGHGGQSEIAYHGAGQLGTQKVDDQKGARRSAADEK